MTVEDTKNINSTCLSISDLTVAYDRKPVLWDINLSIPAGKLVAIVGPNGAGKSSLLKAVLGLVKTSSGAVTFFDRNLNSVRDRVGYVPQRESVDWDFPITVLDVVMMGTYRSLGWFKRPSAKERQVAITALEQVGMQDFASRQICDLSGGQQQRAFIARALAQNADLYLMDEPFAGVDSATEGAIVDVLRKMREQGRTVIVVHHDLQTIREYFDWVVLLNLRLINAGPVDEVFSTENIQKTYSGRLTILDRVTEAVRLNEQRQKQDVTTTPI